MSSGKPKMPMKGPPPQPAQLGGIPTPRVDDPICAILLLFYLVGAITNMAIFQINRRRDHKFIFSVLLFGLCMARLVTLSLRMAWASHPRNANLAVAAGVFVQAGVLILFVVNLIFAQRIVRSYHPRFGWSKAVKAIFGFMYACIGAMLVMAISSSVISFAITNPTVKNSCRIVGLVAGTFLALLAFLPIPIALVATFFPRNHRRPEKFGQGRQRTKLSLLYVTALLLALGACFRLAVAYTTPRPATQAAWYHSKGCFYGFNFAIELIVVYLYAASRFDRRFHVPNGSNMPGNYSGTRVLDEKRARSPPAGGSRRPSGGSRGSDGLSGQGSIGASYEVNREVDVFGDDGYEDSPEAERRRQSEWEARALEELKCASALEHV